MCCYEHNKTGILWDARDGSDPPCFISGDCRGLAVRYRHGMSETERSSNSARVIPCSQVGSGFWHAWMTGINGTFAADPRAASAGRGELALIRAQGHHSRSISGSAGHQLVVGFRRRLRRGHALVVGNARRRVVPRRAILCVDDDARREPRMIVHTAHRYVEHPWAC